jgi:hypothetical protein
MGLGVGLMGPRVCVLNAGNFLVGGVSGLRYLQGEVSIFFCQCFCMAM